MNRFEQLAKGILMPMNPYASALLGFLTLFWGLWIVNPFWDVFSTANVYHRALEFAPEWAWGTWSTTCGALIILSLYTGAAKLLSRSLAFAVWHWGTVSIMLWWGDWQNTAGLTYTFIALYTIFAYLNIKTNYVRMGIGRI